MKMILILYTVAVVRIDRGLLSSAHDSIFRRTDGIATREQGYEVSRDECGRTATPITTTAVARSAGLETP